MPADLKIEDDTQVINPVNVLEKDMPVDGTIIVEFYMPLVERQTSVKLSGGGTTVNLLAMIKGSVLYVTYSGLKYGTEYTVTIPQGCVKSREHGTLNEELVWIFNTRFGFNSYMNEVEDNLPNLYQKAEDLNWDLTFDEGDELFGR